MFIDILMFIDLQMEVSLAQASRSLAKTIKIVKVASVSPLRIALCAASPVWLMAALTVGIVMGWPIRVQMLSLSAFLPKTASAVSVWVMRIAPMAAVFLWTGCRSAVWTA